MTGNGEHVEDTNYPYGIVISTLNVMCRFKLYVYMYITIVLGCFCRIIYWMFHLLWD